MLICCCKARLQSKEDQEGDHQTEQTHGLGQGKAQNGVREELRLERWVTRVANDQWAEHCSDTWWNFSINTSLVLLGFRVLTSAGTGNTDGGGTGTNELGGGVNVAVGNGGGQGALNNN